jgi:hypothetical protein
MFTNGLARGIQRKPVGYYPQGYLYAAVAFVGFGIWVGTVRERQAEFRQRRLDALLEAREARGSLLKRELDA